MSTLETVSNNHHLLFSYLVVYARWLVAGVLLLAGAGKGRDAAEFASTIRAFRLLPGRLARQAALVVIALEVGAGLSLLVGVGTHLAALVAVGLFGVFTSAIVINLARQNILDCGCFGPYFREKIRVGLALRNLLFIALCLFVWRFYDGYLALDSWLFGEAALPGQSPVPFILLTAVVLLAATSLMTAFIVVRNFNGHDDKVVS